MDFLAGCILESILLFSCFLTFIPLRFIRISSRRRRGQRQPYSAGNQVVFLVPQTRPITLAPPFFASESFSTIITSHVRASDPRRCSNPR